MKKVTHWLALGLGLSGLCAQEPASAPKPKADFAPTSAVGAGPIDFARIDRSIGKTPQLTQHARYGLFLFGSNGEHRVWAILDRSSPEARAFDVLYLDRDADGDLTEPGDTFAPAKEKPKGEPKDGVTFVVGDLVDPGTSARHTGVTLTWTDASVRYRMQWRGGKVTFGGFGPARETYAQFAAEPAKAPVYVPGWDRPFQFEHWLSGELKRDEVTDFKVFVGNAGDRRGAFSAVDDEFLPQGAVPVATLLWTDRNGKPRESSFPLPERC
jgi:hypothetical protein